VGDNEVIFIKNTKHTKAVSILLRGANDFLLDEMDRSLHDVLCVVQRVLESKSVVAGGGAVEAALSMYLEAFATTLATKEQLAIREFAEALLTIPKTLAVNAAKDATELVAKLCAFHTAAQQSPEKSDLRFIGLDLVNGKTVNNLAVGVVEPAMSKVKSLKFATEAAITILRIDDVSARAVLHPSASLRWRLALYSLTPPPFFLKHCSPPPLLISFPSSTVH
jgi:T-complex protein 1 subunit alpha